MWPVHTSKPVTVPGTSAQRRHILVLRRVEGWTAGKVFALEADPSYAELLFKSARTLSEMYASVVPLCAAVADRSSILELVIAKRGHSRNRLQILASADGCDAEAVKQVVSVTGDFLLAHWPKPDFVKVDVEGAELLFLAGATKVSRRPGQPAT